jgi:hypothetical protein
MRFKEFSESRILPANQLVTVYVHGQDNKGHVIRHPVVKNFPHKDIDRLLDYLVHVKHYNPQALYWEAGSQFNESELDELIQPEIQRGEGFTKTHTDELGLIWTAHSRGEFDLTVDVQSPHQGQIAYITLEVNPDEQTMSSQDTWVDKKWRRMGIATKMYNWAEKLGNTVVDSSTLSRMGKKFWKNRKANQSSL